VFVKYEVVFDKEEYSSWCEEVKIGCGFAKRPRGGFHWFTRWTMGSIQARVNMARRSDHLRNTDSDRRRSKGPGLEVKKKQAQATRHPELISDLGWGFLWDVDMFPTTSQPWNRIAIFLIHKGVGINASRIQYRQPHSEQIYNKIV
jgi:hypothetical protein